MDDTSLDEFLDDDERDETPEQEADQRDERGESTTVEPAVSTSKVVVGEACSGCGTDDVRLWTDEGAFVCRDCKEW
jgi:hypothetical protein